ncbi:hypothetical protein CBER1_07476 [Cercospora berteroae]|uniref:UBC core domain-containing protein n=1 Tax=Cercospora berteroae TaxID=357750 RepID=A0A2S6BTG3_9PEZI|nr:hypothetical protein CBER1_07476 [Cercospora berteroae]
MDNGDAPRKRRRSSRATTPPTGPGYTARSNVIDLTADSPPTTSATKTAAPPRSAGYSDLNDLTADFPANGLPTTTTASPHSSLADFAYSIFDRDPITRPESMTNDEAYARQLQARYDAEASGANPSSSNSKASSSRRRSHKVDDKTYARPLKTHSNGEGSAHRNTSISKPIDLDSPPLPGSSKSSSTFFSRRGTAVQTGARLSPEDICNGIRGYRAKVANHKCSHCSKTLFGGQAAILTVFAALVAPSWGVEQAIPCPGCRAPNWSVNESATVIWALLCGFDHNSEFNKPVQKKPTPLQRTLGRRYIPNTGTGTGYDDSRTFEQHAQNFALNNVYGPHHMRTPSEPAFLDRAEANADDEMTRRVLDLIASLLPAATKSNSSPDRLRHLFLGSSILDRAAELFRNNDIENVTKNAKLYMSLARFTRTLAHNPATAALVSGDRIVRNPAASILQISLSNGNLAKTAQWDTSQPLANCMRDLATQCSMMLRSSGSGVNEEHLRVFRAIKELNATLKPKAGTNGQPDQDSWHKGILVSEVADEEIMSKHHFAAKPLAYSPPGRMTRIMQELARLQTSLPNGIFVRYASSRPDIMKVLIVGPRDTPYENGLFEFDMFCGENFPNEPPKMHFRTTAGKICLSLLGTWEGEPWSTKSTLLQVLVSIQSMILCEKPYFNEPGYANHPQAEGSSKKYNEALYHRTIKNGMLDWLDRRRYAPAAEPQQGAMGGFYFRGRGVEQDSGTIDQSKDIWDDIVKKHFASCEQEILKTVKKWMAEVHQAGTERPSVPRRPSIVSPAPPTVFSNFGSQTPSGYQWSYGPAPSYAGSLLPGMTPINYAPQGAYSSAAYSPSPPNAMKPAPAPPVLPSLTSFPPGTADARAYPSRVQRVPAQNKQEMPELNGTDFVAKLLQAVQFMKSIAPSHGEMGMHEW